MVDIGSGVLVSKNPPIVASVAHVYRDNPNGVMACTFPATGETCVVTRRASDGDVAVLELQKAPSTWAVGLADRCPVRGEKVTAVGFDYGRTFRTRVATLVRSSGDECEASCQSVDGNSGGPVYNASGRLIGVIHGVTIGGSQERRTIVHGCGIIRRLIGVLCRGVQKPAAQPRRSDGPSSAPSPNGTNNGSGKPSAGESAPSKPSDASGIVPEIDYDKLADIVLARMKAEPERWRGEKGDPGPPGPAATLDIEAIAAAIAKTLPPIHFRTVLPDGKVTDEESVPLGGTLDITHYRIAPGGDRVTAK